MKKIKVKRDKTSKYRTDVVPPRKNRVLCIVLRENKSTIWKWLSYKQDRFSIDGNTYFREPSGVYLSKNKVLMSVYIEGVSTPIGHNNIDRSLEKKTYIDPLTQKTKTVEVPRINNLKFDSEIIDILLNRHLADEFTRVAVDGRGILTVLILLAVLGVCIANLGVLLS